MSELQFEESVTQKVNLSRPESKLSTWLIKNGIVQSEAVANLVLMVLSGVFILIAIFIFLRQETEQKELINPSIFSSGANLEERRNMMKSLPRDQFIPLKESNEN